MNNYYLYTAIVSPDPDVPERMILIGEISKVHVSKVGDLPKPRVNFKRKVWKCGDKASEDVYREQGWFPD